MMRISSLERDSFYPCVYPFCEKLFTNIITSVTQCMTTKASENMHEIWTEFGWWAWRLLGVNKLALIISVPSCNPDRGFRILLWAFHLFPPCFVKSQYRKFKLFRKPNDYSPTSFSSVLNTGWGGFKLGTLTCNGELPGSNYSLVTKSREFRGLYPVLTDDWRDNAWYWLWPGSSRFWPSHNSLSVRFTVQSTPRHFLFDGEYWHLLRIPFKNINMFFL
jgi:hypothetical protein